MNRVAHNLSVSSDFIQDQLHWMHTLSVVISDVNDEDKTIDHSEQMNMTVEPAMKPEDIISGLRALADKIEEYTGEA